MRRSVVVAALPPAVLFALALGVRLSQHHAALLYPDGYQYLLMARGIGEHLQPTTVLGPGGDGFAPSPDAAAKPLFPLLVAGVHALGGSWLDAARFVTAIAAAATVVAAALLTAKLSGSRLGGFAVGMLLLASPSLGFWSGFSGPDPVAQALALAAALAFVHRRPRLGGVLTGLAIATRPEIAVVAIAAAIVATRNEGTRKDARHAAPAAVLAWALVITVLRTPIAVPDWQLVSLAPLLLLALGLAAIAPPTLVRYGAIAGLGAAALVILTTSGPADLWRNDWPLLVLGAAGLVVLVRDQRRGAIAVLTLGAAVLLGAVYLMKNPSLERYFSLLLPLAALLVGIAVAALPQRARPLALGAVALAVAAGFLRPVPGSRDYDMFSVVAKRVAPTLHSDALVTAAPDAYSFWLPAHRVREMRPGVRGAILLDAAQRLYKPGLTAKGMVVARVVDEIAFSRPNGEIDAEPAVLVTGAVAFADAPRLHRRARRAN
jgi:4-amino-4-deoxy-L-arabinose transferase-like glycosyltransferase